MGEGTATCGLSPGSSLCSEVFRGLTGNKEWNGKSRKHCSQNILLGERYLIKRLDFCRVIASHTSEKFDLSTAKARPASELNFLIKFSEAIRYFSSTSPAVLHDSSMTVNQMLAMG